MQAQSGEIQQVWRRYRERVQAILTADELVCYEAYQQRIRRAIDRGDVAPIPVSEDEQRVLDKIAADIEATAIDRQFLTLIRVAKLPQ
jgi:precorrin-3B methylase